eukprot:2575299-Heterocapsa_arctica.AAC.1
MIIDIEARGANNVFEHWGRTMRSRTWTAGAAGLLRDESQLAERELCYDRRPDLLDPVLFR